MTEEEKKEFEEFLQWKAEKKKKEEEAKAQEEVKNLENTQDNKQKEEVGLWNQEFPKSSFQVEKNSISKQKTTSTQNNTQVEDSQKFEKIIIMLFAIILIVVAFLATCGKSVEKPAEKTPEEIAFSKQQDSIDKVEAAEYAKEKHRQDSIKRAERIELLKHTIRIKKAYISTPNSAGGVDATIIFKNVSNKTIKYFRWSGYPINAVGDPVSCTIRDYCESGGKATGPIKPGVTFGYGRCWECLWYNYSAKKLILTGAEIEYMDGSTISISKNELKYIR